MVYGKKTLLAGVIAFMMVIASVGGAKGAEAAGGKTEAAGAKAAAVGGKAEAQADAAGAMAEDAPGSEEGKEGMGYRERNEIDFTWSASGDVPKTGDKAIDAKTKAFIEKTIGESIQENATQFTLDEEVLDEGMGRWSIWFDGSVSRPSDRAVSVRMDFFTFFFKAAHPLGVSIVKQYRVSDGAELTLDNIFANPAKALEIMAKMAPDIITAQLKKDSPDLFTDGRDNMYDEMFRTGFNPTRENYAAFMLEPNGVRVIFQQYQVLAYVFGMPEALIPLKDLQPAGPNPEIWPMAK